MECLWADGWFGELGREPTVELYIAHMVECLGRDSEVWRVLSPYGTLWLNLGGCYASASAREANPRQRPDLPHPPGSWSTRDATSHGRTAIGIYKPLDYIPVPHLVAMALQKEGWYWRSTIVWHKKSPMPGSMATWRWERCRVKVEPGAERKQSWGAAGVGMRDHSGYEFHGGAKYEPCPGCPKCEPHGGLVLRYGAWRPTTAHEYVFLFSKTNRYYCDQDAVRTSAKESSIKRLGRAVSNQHKMTDGAPEQAPHTLSQPRANVKPPRFGGNKASGYGTRLASGNEWDDVEKGANARSVQSWPTANLGLDHFAAFSVEMAAWCIKAGTSPRGYCPKCNRPWVRVVERHTQNRSGWGQQGLTAKDVWNKGKWAGDVEQDYKRDQHDIRLGPTSVVTTLGWKATCECCECGHSVARHQAPGAECVVEGCRCSTYRLAEPRKGIVLDPFGGSGTVGLAAKGLGRSYILCEISEEYVAMAEARIRKGFTPGRKKQEIPEAQMRLGL